MEEKHNAFQRFVEALVKLELSSVSSEEDFLNKFSLSKRLLEYICSNSETVHFFKSISKFESIILNYDNTKPDERLLKSFKKHLLNILKEKLTLD